MIREILHLEVLIGTHAETPEEIIAVPVEAVLDIIHLTIVIVITAVEIAVVQDIQDVRCSIVCSDCFIITFHDNQENH